MMACGFPFGKRLNYTKKQAGWNRGCTYQALVPGHIICPAGGCFFSFLSAGPKIGGIIDGSKINGNNR
jgi:hypothetical protein